ncbi:uncharacterized protein LOC126285441 isoform X1 [Schistocerca gregaria]|uniref:uncharacterized protein LOC126285441 isoform X1 n=1 Tax=Schistocerca gregaria TaxID=7010 RepID=UPI00211EF5AC|nr:uncharacterized protein LOC126285441 isoform X1 [Schistocerca gregaria]
MNLLRKNQNDSQCVLPSRRNEKLLVPNRLICNYTKRTTGSEMTVCLQPQSLQELVMAAVVTNVCQRVRQFLAGFSQHGYILKRLIPKRTKMPPSSLKPLHEFLYSNLPPVLCAQLCEELLAAFQNLTREEAEAGVGKSGYGEARWQLMNDVLEALLHPQLWNLNLSLWPSALASTFYRNVRKLTGLKRLGLQGALRPDAWLPECLPGLRTLVSVDLRESGSDLLVAALAQNCPMLAELHLAWAEAVTDRAVPALLQMRSLHWLDIGETGISISGVSDLISGLPSLYEIAVGVDLPLEPIIICQSQCRLSLQHLKLVETRRLEEVLAKTPDLTRLELIAPLCSLAPLSTLPYLTDLRLDLSPLPPQPNDAVEAVRTANPGRLQHLTLAGCTAVDLPALMSECPQLHSLHLMHCSFAVPEHNQEWIPSVVRMPNLQELTLSTLQQVQVWFILEHLLPAARVSLRHLTIDTVMVPCVGSHRLGNLLLAAPLPAIETLALRGKILLTASTLRHFANTNPSLKSLGRVEFWDRVTSEDLRYLREDLCGANKRLTIL